jgi:inorganic pyrophosphatase
MLILNEEPAVLGALVKVRLLGVIEAERTEEGKMVRNDRIVGMALDEAQMNQIAFFFAAYNKISGKEFKARKIEGLKQAEKFIEAGVKLREAEKTRIKCQPPVFSYHAKTWHTLLIA